jgi:hypothetical protein
MNRLSTVLLLAIALCMLVGHADAQIDTFFSNECTHDTGLQWVTGYPSSCSGLLSLMKEANAYVSCAAPSAGPEPSNLQILAVPSGLAFNGYLWPNDKCNGNSANVWVCRSNRNIKTAIFPVDMVKYGQAVIQNDQAALSQLLDAMCSAALGVM